MTPRRLALVTGAGRNLGRAIALALADAGMDVAVNVRGDVDAGERVAREVQQKGAASAVFPADVASESSVSAMFDSIGSTLGRTPDVLVNNASIRPRQSLLAMTFDDWRRVQGVALDGAFLCTRAALPGMVERSHGRIVNIIGRAAFTGHPAMAHVVAAKAGLHGLTRAIALEFGPRGVTANSVSPGPIRADDGSLPGGLSESQLLPTIPSRHVVSGADIAAVCVFLATDPGTITGQVIHADGGQFIA